MNENLGSGCHTQELWRFAEYRKMQSEAHKGKPNSNRGKRGIWKISVEAKQKISEKQKGHPLYGPIKHLESTKRKISLATKILWRNPEFRQKIIKASSKGRMGKKLSLEHRKRLSESHIGKKQPEWLVEKRIRSTIKSLSKRPTGPEKRMMEIINQNSLPLTYNKGELVIGRKIPDFYFSNDDKRLVEVFGRAFHDPNHGWLPISAERTYEGTIEYYKRFNRDCVIFWEDEISQDIVLEKLGVST